jgi:AraC-like DNA-binding protein
VTATPKRALDVVVSVAVSIRRADEVVESLPDTRAWSTASTLSEFAVLCCEQPHISLVSDPDSVSLAHRVSRIGPLAIGELEVGSDMWLDCGEVCSAYRVNVMRSGRLESVHRRSPITAGPGSITVYQPQGDASARWEAGSRMVAVKIDRCVVDDALSDALGRPVTSQIDFQPAMSTTTGAGTSWLSMVLMLTEQLFRPDSVLTRPLVASPFVDSLVRGLLLAADHPYHDAVTAEPKEVAPRHIRAALDIIEAEPHLPLTVSALAARTHVSVRGLQQGFRRHLGTSPMAYLREVRLRRAHQTLVQSDPSITTVASIAYQWGFTNLGRFAAAHAARYDETPAVTLRRTETMNGFQASA